MNERSKALKAQKAKSLEGLYYYMKTRNIDRVGSGKQTITIEKCNPNKKRAKVKPKKQRREDAIELFREVGINDPINFYEDFEKTQKNNRGVEINSNKKDDTQYTDDYLEELFGSSKKKGKKRKDEAYDDMLGF